MTYRHGDRIRAYIVGVERTERGRTPFVAHPPQIAGSFNARVPDPGLKVDGLRDRPDAAATEGTRWVDPWGRVRSVMV